MTIVLSHPAVAYLIGAVIMTIVEGARGVSAETAWLGAIIWPFALPYIIGRGIRRAIETRRRHARELAEERERWLNARLPG